MIEIGQSVGNYVVRAKLGEGGMGVVYLAEHPVIGRKAALKVIHPQYARNAEVVSRFVTEATSVNRIGHEHIVDVTDFGRTPDGDFYFTMEYLQGQALVDRIARGPRFPPEKALHIAAQIADALQASHDHGVIHRDLKPDNIILVAHGGDHDFVKVLDFGLAKLVHPVGTTPTHSTQVGLVLGTPYYMAPEQCEAKEIDHRADVYALGVILFEMLTGKLPFGGDSYGEIMIKQINMTPPAASSIVPDLPPALDIVLFRALAKNPDQRFQSMAELRTALLDPSAYASSLPELGVEHDRSGRVRAAGPMARSEIDLRPTPVGTPPDTTTARQRRSTPYEGVGEISEGADSIARLPRAHHYARWVGVVAAAALSILVLSRTSVCRRPVARVVAAAYALSRPATVRVNFNSDPTGATVARADGLVLGVTPLSTEVPFADAPRRFVVSKAGFRSKSVSLVPNLSSPVFAVLRADDPPPMSPIVEPVSPPQVAPAVVAVRAAPAAAGRRPVARARAPHKRSETPVEASIDPDETLPPSIRE